MYNENAPPEKPGACDGGHHLWLPVPASREHDSYYQCSRCGAFMLTPSSDPDECSGSVF